MATLVSDISLNQSLNEQLTYYSSQTGITVSGEGETVGGGRIWGPTGNTSKVLYYAGWNNRIGQGARSAVQTYLNNRAAAPPK